MTLEEAIQVAERLEREDCIGTTSLALRTLYKAFKENQHDSIDYQQCVEKLQTMGLY